MIRARPTAVPISAAECVTKQPRFSLINSSEATKANVPVAKIADGAADCATQVSKKVPNLRGQTEKIRNLTSELKERRRRLQTPSCATDPNQTLKSNAVGAAAAAATTTTQHIVTDWWTAKAQRRVATSSLVHIDHLRTKLRSLEDTLTMLCEKHCQSSCNTTEPHVAPVPSVQAQQVWTEMQYVTREKQRCEDELYATIFELQVLSDTSSGYQNNAQHRVDSTVLVAENQRLDQQVAECQCALEFSNEVIAAQQDAFATALQAKQDEIEQLMDRLDQAETSANESSSSQLEEELAALQSSLAEIELTKCRLDATCIQLQERIQSLEDLDARHSSDLQAANTLVRQLESEKLQLQEELADKRGAKRPKLEQPSTGRSPHQLTQKTTEKPDMQQWNASCVSGTASSLESGTAPMSVVAVQKMQIADLKTVLAAMQCMREAEHSAAVKRIRELEEEKAVFTQKHTSAMWKLRATRAAQQDDRALLNVTLSRLEKENADLNRELDAFRGEKYAATNTFNATNDHRDLQSAEDPDWVNVYGKTPLQPAILGRTDIANTVVAFKMCTTIVCAERLPQSDSQGRPEAVPWKQESTIGDVEPYEIDTTRINSELDDPTSNPGANRNRAGKCTDPQTELVDQKKSMEDCRLGLRLLGFPSPTSTTVALSANRDDVSLAASQSRQENNNADLKYELGAERHSQSTACNPSDNVLNSGNTGNEHAVAQSGDATPTVQTSSSLCTSAASSETLSRSPYTPGPLAAVSCKHHATQQVTHSDGVEAAESSELDFDSTPFNSGENNGPTCFPLANGNLVQGRTVSLVVPQSPVPNSVLADKRQSLEECVRGLGFLGFTVPISRTASVKHSVESGDTTPTVQTSSPCTSAARNETLPRSPDTPGPLEAVSCKHHTTQVTPSDGVEAVESSERDFDSTLINSGENNGLSCFPLANGHVVQNATVSLAVSHSPVPNRDLTDKKRSLEECVRGLGFLGFTVPKSRTASVDKEHHSVETSPSTESQPEREQNQRLSDCIATLAFGLS
jgi:hypothetical protein